MFNFITAEFIEVIQLVFTFLGLFGLILFLLISADKPVTKNLYFKRAK